MRRNHLVIERSSRGRAEPFVRVRHVATVAVIAGLLAGCGGDDDTSAVSSAPAAEPVASAAPEPAAEPAPASGGGDWCGLAQEVEDETLLGGDINPFAESSDFLRTAMETLLDLAPTIRDRAPSEIADDVDTVLSAFEQLNEILADADYDIMAIDQTTFATLSTDAVETASNNIERYNEEVCGIPAVSSDDSFDATTVTLPPEAQDVLNDSIVSSLAAELGIPTEQAACLIEQLDISQLMGGGDPSVLQQAFEDCGVDPSLIGS